MNTDDIVNQFAKTLQNCNAKPSILYGEKKSDSSIYQDVKVKDVITIIFKQLKAIKNADIIRPEVRQNKTLCLNKKSDVVSANFIPMEIQSNLENKIETQCILDTQLIDLIKNAESVIEAQNNNHTDNGVCQELENNDLKKSDFIRTCNKNPDKTFTKNVKNIDVNTCQNKDLNDKINLNNILKIKGNKNKLFEASDSGQKNRKINDYINDNDEFNDSDHSSANELEVPSSPILGIVKHIPKLQPLIYKLEEFDKFESLAAPVLNELTDLEDAKRIINSQLKATNHFLKTHSEIVTTNKQIECRDLSTFINKLKSQYSFDINSGAIDNNVVEDEMLFDSDDDIKHAEELPLTSSLETSACNNIAVLDKTKYVGFQTARNQSKQFLSDPFKEVEDVLDYGRKTVARILSNIELEEAFYRKTPYENDDVMKENDNKIMKKKKSTTLNTYHSGKNIIEYKNITQNGGNLITEQIDEHIMREFENNLMSFEDKITVNSNEIDNSHKHFTETNTSTKISIDANSLKRTSNPNLIGFKNLALSKTTNMFDYLLKDENDLQSVFSDRFKEADDDMDNIRKLVDQMLSIIELVEAFDRKTPHENDDVMKENDNKIMKKKKSTTLNTYHSGKNIIEYKNITQNGGNLITEQIDEHIMREFENNLMSFEDKITVNSNEIDNSHKHFTETNTSTKISIDANSLKRTSNPNLIGFETASNKIIRISDLALSKTRNMFDCQLNDENELQSVFSDPFKEVEDVLVYGRKTVARILSNIELEEAFYRKTPYENDDVMKENDNNIMKKKISTTLNTYHSGKNIIEYKNITQNGGNLITEQIDEHIMREFENNLMSFEDKITVNSNEIDNSHKHFTETNTSTKISIDANSLKRTSNPNLIGFKTASNKITRISDLALSKTRNMFDDIDINNTEKYFNTDLAGSPKERNSDFVGFKTANNKKIKISAQAVMNTKNIFDNIDNEISCNCQNDENDLQSKRLKTKPVLSGFINSISLKNIKRCATFPLKELEKKETNPSKNNKKYSKDIIYKVANHFQEFKTANTKNIIISDSALKKPNIFQAVKENQSTRELDVIENELNLVNNITCLPFKGFKTANNKPIKISDEALLKTKKVFQDIENGSTYPDDGYIVQPSVRQDFKTTIKETVVISQEAFGKPMILFQDFKDNIKNLASHQRQPVQNSPNLKLISVSKEVTPITDKLVKNPCFAGFQTASNKTVQISEEASLKSKKILDDIDFNNKNKDTYKTDAMLKGFCTASNKKNHISEDALVKSGKILDNLCDQNQYCDEELKKNIKSKLKNHFGNNINIIKQSDTHKPKEIIIHEDNKITENGIHIEDFLNTEISRIFESIHTDDFFRDTIPKCKRSGSPILSCARPKKFKTPKSSHKIMDRDTKIVQPLNLFKFSENYKKIKKYKLTDILSEKSENLIENIDPYLFDFNFDTFLEFRFENNRNDFGNDSWTTDKIKIYFTDSVNKKIIPEGWIDNHLRLIIWKLISYELFSPKHMKYACSIKNVLQQLKYRYDRELYNVERPALRKILEKDNVSTKLMILCVASFYVDGVSASSITKQIKNIELLLTDGWYCVKAKADGMIDRLIIDGKISIGTKLAIHGAELTNCEQGISPWEDTSTVRLKISGNSTKRAKWDVRLGFHGNGAMMSRLPAVSLEGGKISKLRLFVTRVYPTMYVEKFEDGSTVTRTERLEHLHQMKCETERQIQMENLYDEVVKMSEQESDDSEDQYTEQGNLDTGSQISRLMKKSKDPLGFKKHMLNEHTDRQNEKLLQKIQNKAQLLIKKRGLDVARNVVPVMKVRVFDERKAMLTIWRPNESLLDLIKEGAWIDAYNVVPTSIRYSEIQISAGRQSMFCKSKFKETDRLRILTETLKRKCYTIKDLQSSKTTNYNEIDTFGLVFLIEPKNYDGSKELFQNVYVCDVDKSIISVKFWGGVKKFGFENILQIGQTVACVNLQKPAGNTRYIPQYRATEYTYFTETPKFDSARKLLDELSAKLLKNDKHKIIQECVDIKNNFLNFKYSNTENVSPYRMNNSEYNISRNIIFIDSPLIGKDLNSNLESNFKQTRELSPNSLLRKKKVDEKIAKLRIYGEPPPLNHMHMINKSSKALRQYKSPLISNNVSSSAANANFKNINNVTSGTLSVNKMSSSVLDRSSFKINPVKLNFASEENNLAEELDSPPLSLDLNK